MSSTKYEPLPRYDHISERVGSKIVMQGGMLRDFSTKSTRRLRSVVEIFDPYSESWEQREVGGNAPPLGTFMAASAQHHDYLFSFGGWDGIKYFNSVHRLDTKTWCWNQESPQNSYGAPMPKYGSGMISFGDKLMVLCGCAMPQETILDQSFIKDTRFRDGRGWTNECHI